MNEGLEEFITAPKALPFFDDLWRRCGVKNPRAAMKSARQVQEVCLWVKQGTREAANLYRQRRNTVNPFRIR